MFLYYCMRVKDKAHPFKSRCKKGVGKNGILCENCYSDAKKHPVFVLMHKEISKQFGIPFKNQICVEINLNKNKDVRPENKNDRTVKEKEVRTILFESMLRWSEKKLREFHDGLKLNVWDKLKKLDNEYSFRYHLTKDIMEKLIALGT